ncbi:MAG: hypothetical protein ACFB0B_10395 [Thermonemataceae bacterium]
MFLATLASAVYAQESDKELELLMQKQKATIGVLQERTKQIERYIRQLEYQHRLQTNALQSQTSLIVAQDTTYFKNAIDRLHTDYQRQLQELKAQVDRENDSEVVRVQKLETLVGQYNQANKEQQSEQQAMLVYGAIIVVLCNVILFLILLNIMRSKQTRLVDDVTRRQKEDVRSLFHTLIREDLRREIVNIVREEQEEKHPKAKPANDTKEEADLMAKLSLMQSKMQAFNEALEQQQQSLKNADKDTAFTPIINREEAIEKEIDPTKKNNGYTEGVNNDAKKEVIEDEVTQPIQKEELSTSGSFKFVLQPEGIEKAKEEATEKQETDQLKEETFTPTDELENASIEDNIVEEMFEEEVKETEELEEEIAQEVIEETISSTEVENTTTEEDEEETTLTEETLEISTSPEEKATQEKKEEEPQELVEEVATFLAEIKTNSTDESTTEDTIEKDITASSTPLVEEEVFTTPIKSEEETTEEVLESPTTLIEEDTTIAPIEQEEKLVEEEVIEESTLPVEEEIVTTPTETEESAEVIEEEVASSFKPLVEEEIFSISSDAEEENIEEEVATQTDETSTEEETPIIEEEISTSTTLPTELEEEQETIELTETDAIVLFNEGRLQEALDIYKKLIAYYPDKKRYYTTQMEIMGSDIQQADTPKDSSVKMSEETIFERQEEAVETMDYTPSLETSEMIEEEVLVEEPQTFEANKKVEALETDEEVEEKPLVEEPQAFASNGETEETPIEELETFEVNEEAEETLVEEQPETFEANKEEVDTLVEEPRTFEANEEIEEEPFTEESQTSEENEEVAEILVEEPQVFETNEVVEENTLVEEQPEAFEANKEVVDTLIEEPQVFETNEETLEEPFTEESQTLEENEEIEEEPFTEESQILEEDEKKAEETFDTDTESSYKMIYSPTEVEESTEELPTDDELDNNITPFVERTLNNNIEVFVKEEVLVEEEEDDVVSEEKFFKNLASAELEEEISTLEENGAMLATDDTTEEEELDEFFETEEIEVDEEIEEEDEVVEEVSTGQEKSFMGVDYDSNYWLKKATEAYKAKQFERAIGYYTKVIKEGSETSYIAYTKRANCFHILREYDKAVSDYEQAIRLNPEFIPAYNNAVEIHILTDNFFQALTTLEQLSRVEKPTHYKAVELYLKLIAQKALHQTTDKTERELDELLRENFNFNFSFKEIEDWLVTADIEPTNKRMIQVKTELLKMKRAA